MFFKNNNNNFVYVQTQVIKVPKLKCNYREKQMVLTYGIELDLNLIQVHETGLQKLCYK